MKKIKFFGLLVVMIISTLYHYQQPEKVEATPVKQITMTLEGAFLKEGTVEIKEGMTVGDLIDFYGVKDNANLKALNMKHVVHGEDQLYLPEKCQKSISLNQASKEELMQLDGIGEKTAQKIIDYRSQTPFETLEDLMNVSGIGEKRYLKYRDLLCL